LVKDIVNRILLTITLTGLIIFLLNWFIFPEVSIGYKQQEEMASFIYLGFYNNLFFNFIPALISLLSLIIIIIRNLPKNFFSRKKE